MEHPHTHIHIFSHKESKAFVLQICILKCT